MTFAGHFEPSLTGVLAFTVRVPRPVSRRLLVRYLRPSCPHEGLTRGLDHRPYATRGRSLA